jgi:hypothetical protein
MQIILMQKEAEENQTKAKLMARKSKMSIGLSSSPYSS